jgi:hypothetical protein
MLDISNKNYERIFVIGRLLGDFPRLIRFLHDQNFNHKDAMVLNGDFISTQNPQESISVVEFVEANSNCYALKGEQELDWVDKMGSPNERNLINYQLLGEFETRYASFMVGLPLIIKLPGYYYSVYAGVQPQEGVQAADRDVFASIGYYDQNSRFYQFANPEKKNWFDFKIFDGDKQTKLIFSAVSTEKRQVPAGINLHRQSIDEPLVGIIIDKNASITILETV